MTDSSSRTGNGSPAAGRSTRGGVPRTVPLATLLRQAALDLQAAPVPPWRPLSRRAAAASPRAAPAGRAPGRSVGLAWAWGGVSACALLLLASVWLMGLAGGRGAVPGATITPMAWPAPVRQTGFLPLVANDRWAALAAEGEPAWVVRTELPADRLAAMGLPYDPAYASERVRAELLLHPSGDVLAVRFLR